MSGEVAGIDALKHYHPRILAQFPGNLGVTHVDRIDLGRVGTGNVLLISSALHIFDPATDASHSRTFTGQPHSNGMADPAPRPGHNRNLILKSHLGNCTRSTSFLQARKKIKSQNYPRPKKTNSCRTSG